MLTSPRLRGSRRLPDSSETLSVTRSERRKPDFLTLAEVEEAATRRLRDALKLPPLSACVETGLSLTFTTGAFAPHTNERLVQAMSVTGRRNQGGEERKDDREGQQVMLEI